MSECNPYILYVISSGLLALGFFHLLSGGQSTESYGRYNTQKQSVIFLPAKVGWFLMELPSFLVPTLIFYQSGSLESMGSKLLLFLFCGHYFHRTFIYAVRSKGHHISFKVVLSASIFCILNGYLQGHTMIYCTHYDDNWITDFRFTSGVVLYLVGLAINIHSDCILRDLRKAGDLGYYIPQGGLFQYVSGANYFGEIVEWFGYAIATSTYPAYAFAIFTASFLGRRAWFHHRYYLEKFDNYPKSRKAVIPLIL
uniref:3-oxo-5-alpha-steroid 4-dehydrogenase 2-like n=1 Tax=Pristiophorus japonicus TaxID=55135 RepID=UPI00398F2261